MQRVLLLLAGCNFVPSRTKLLYPLFLLFGLTGHAQSSGIFESYAILSINGGANAYYDMQATTALPDFQGANLGSFVFGTNSLVVKGGQNKTFKNGGCDITGSSINYRVYKTGATPGSFVSINEPFDSNLSNPGDQIWQGTGGATNLIASLTPGSYTLEVYSQASYTGCGSGTHFSSNSGANYKATFTVTAANPVFVTSTSGTAVASYATLKAAFDAVNAGTHSGSINVEISGNTTESVVAALNASGSGAASYTTMSITPTGNVSVIGSLASELILFNGADNVTINGLNTGGNSLTISNTSTSATSGTSTIKYIGGATGNTVTNCTVLGSATVPVGTNGGTFFFSTDGNTANGNDNNTISNCNIGAAGGNFPTKAIYGNGSTTTKAIGNSGIVITGNNIYDFFGAATSSAGIYIPGGCNNWSVTNNKFYQTGARSWTTGAQHSPIWITSTTATSGAQGFAITGNIIGYASNAQTGTYALTGSGNSARFWGIYFNGISASTADVTTISNNTVASVSMTGVTGAGTSTSSPFMGIHFQEGVAITNGNIIGSGTSAGSLVFSTTTTSATDVFGIYNFSSNNWTSNNNTIGGISVTNLASSTTLLFGLRCNTLSSVNWTATGNTVGGSAANSVQLNALGTASQLFGIYNTSSPATLSSNVVKNLTTNIGTGTTTGASLIGMYIPATQNQTISQNTLSNFSNTNATAASVVLGLYTVGLTNTVDRNFIHSLGVASTSASAEVSGIRVAGGTTTFKNNMVALGNEIANAVQVNGIVETSGTDNFYHNSIYVGGTATAGTAASYAFNSQVTGSTRAFRDNIFVNNRSNSGATGKNYIVRVGGAAANPSGLTINNNVYFGNGSGSVFGFFNAADVASLAAWKTAVGQDAASFNADPQFLNATATTPNLHINATVATPVEGSGALIAAVTDDFDGETRSGLSPVDIGADAGNFTAAAAMVYSSSTAAQLTGSVCSAAANVPVLRMEVVTANAASPLTLTSLTINGNGTSNLADIASYRIYYTGTSATFSTGTPIIAATTGLTAANVVVTPSSTVTLSEGTNYFWLVYNLNSSISGPNLDAEFTNVALSTGGGVPSVAAPSGAVSAFQTPSASASSNSPVCSGSALNLSGGTNIGTAFSWTGPNGFTSAEQNPVISNVTAANAGTYNLTVSANGCSSVVSSVVVAVNPTPVAPTTNGYSMCLGASIPSGQGLTSTAVGGTTTTGSQTINFNVVAQPVETNSAPGNTVASANMTALPAGAVVTGVTIAYNNLTALSSSWRSDIKLGLSGALVLAAASDPLAAGSAGTLNYLRTATSGITSTIAGGTVNLLYWDDVNDNTGAEATFPTGSNVASVTVNYSYPSASAVQWYTAATGGTAIGSGSPFNPIGNDPALPDSNTSGNYTYYAQVMNGSCGSARTAAVLQIGSALTISTSATPNTPVCAGTTVALAGAALTGGGNYTYSWKIGATEVSTAATFNVSPMITTTYNLTVTDACMQTVTQSVTVTVNPLPAAVVATGAGTFCATATIAAGNGNDGTIYFQGTTAGGTSTAIASTSQVVTASGTYYFRAQSALGCWGPEGSVAVVINTPAGITGTDASICQNGSGTIAATASNCTGFVNAGTTISGTWTATPTAARPNSSTNSTVCGFSATVTRNYVATNFQVSLTGNYVLEMNSNTAYDGMGYIVSGLAPGTCTGGGTFIIGDDDSGTNSEPKITTTLTAGVTYTLVSTTYSTTSGAYLGSFAWTITPPSGGQIMLNGSGTIEWYTAASGGTAIATGSPFNPVGVAGSGLANTSTPGTTTYYAACSLGNSCRTPVNFVINQNITYYQDADNDTYGNPLVTQLSCTGAPAGYVLDNTDCDDNNALVHQTYPFYVDADHDGFGFGTAVNFCAANANTPPAGYVTNNLDCDDTQILYVDADGDGFGSTTAAACGVANNTDCDDNNNAIHQTFAFYVDADGDGFGAGSLVSVCAANAATPPAGYSLNNTDCNDGNASINTVYPFYVDADGDGYGTGSLVSVCAANATTPPAGYSINNTDCNDNIAAINPGHAEVLYNGVDDNCDGQLDEGFQLTTSLLGSSCGTTLASIGSLVGITTVSSAITGYRIKITNGAQVQIIEKTVPHFTFPQFPSYAYATTYSVQIELQRQGVWLGYYGPVCLVSTPAILEEGGATAVSPSQCGITLPKINTLIATTSLQGVTGYRFRITNLTDPLGPNAVQTIDRTQNWFSLPMLTRYNYGTQYRIEIAVKTTGAFGGFGAPCEVSSPPAPSLINCGGTAASGTSTVAATSVQGATQYRFQITRESDLASATIDRNVNYFIFNSIPASAFTPGALYYIRVAVMTTGTWSPYGDICEYTAPGGTAKGASVQNGPAVASEFKATAYPNPFISDFGIDVVSTSQDDVVLTVYDMLGQKLEIRSVKASEMNIQKVGSQYPSGVYNVILSQGAVIKTLRVVKR